MSLLYHLPFSANCRLVRIALAENKVSFRLVVEAIWERRDSFLALNPEGQVPVFINEQNLKICGASVIIEWLDENMDNSLIGSEIDIRCESRRIMNWFLNKFSNEIDNTIVYEKIMKGFIGKGNPDANILRVGRKNLKIHMEYINWLSKNRDWLAGNEFTIADISAAANISIIDYLGEINWKEYSSAKDWYARIKSRPSFRKILEDKIPGLLPPKYYNDLDF
ncbi:MAG: glutathione S-transferase [Pelagibacterales bacterium]|nr:glutathione S-transferase [Pelagibacterales bacterium]|tara:strand:- start:896 stop:1561 length:666 start_codon:yes stop_codon:yes gene_type:complete